MKTFLVSAIALFISYTVSADVWVYPSPDDKYKSDVYSVEIIQDDISYESFVYEDENNDSKNDMTDYNHWTTFSFQDSVHVKVVISSGGKTLTNCWVHPYPKNITPTFDGDTIWFSITEPGQYFVRTFFSGDNLGTPPQRQGSFGYENPLFIFADPPETDIPDTTSSDVLVIPDGLSSTELRALISSNSSKSTYYFKEGAEHTLGEKFTVSNNKTYYIPGGAYVIGNFIGSAVNNVTIKGRGIVSLVGYPRHGSAANMDWNLIHFSNGGSNQIVDGITFTNPSHFCLLSRGEMHVNWTKMFAWYVQTDGFGGGTGSSVHNTFMKVMDDNVKLYSSNNIIRNLVIYKQKNGAYFQHGWGPSGGTAQNCNVDEVYIVQDDCNGKERSLIEIKENEGKSFSNYTFDSIFADQDVWNVMAMNNKSGSLTNFNISNLIINEPPRTNPHVTANSGEISDFTFTNFKINGSYIRSHADWNLVTTGNINNFVYIAGDDVNISISKPINNKTYQLGDTVVIETSVYDTKSKVQRVDFFIDSDSIGTDSTEPYTYSIPDLTEGSYTLSVKAIVNVDSAYESGTVNISVVSYAPAKILHLLFDEGSGTTATDSSEFATNGTLVNNVAWATLNDGFGVKLNNSNYVEVPHCNECVVNNQLTLMAWIMPEELGNWDGIITKGTTQSPYALQISNNNSGKLRFTPNYGTPPNSVGGGNFDSQATLALNEWTHVALTYDGATIKHYINGAEDNASAATIVFGTVSEPTVIGCDFPGGDEFFKGIIDDVRIYNYAVDPSVISEAASVTKVGINKDAVTENDFYISKNTIYFNNAAANDLKVYNLQGKLIIHNANPETIETLNGLSGLYIVLVNNSYAVKAVFE